MKTQGHVLQLFMRICTINLVYNDYLLTQAFVLFHIYSEQKLINCIHTENLLKLRCNLHGLQTILFQTPSYLCYIFKVDVYSFSLVSTCFFIIFIQSTCSYIVSLCTQILLTETAGDCIQHYIWWLWHARRRKWSIRNFLELHLSYIHQLSKKIFDGKKRVDMGTS